jgi:hypothetical protein
MTAQTICRASQDQPNNILMLHPRAQKEKQFGNYNLGTIDYLNANYQKQSILALI